MKGKKLCEQALFVDPKAVISLKVKVQIYQLLLTEVIIICLLLVLIVSVKVYLIK